MIKVGEVYQLQYPKELGYLKWNGVQVKVEFDVSPNLFSVQILTSSSELRNRGIDTTYHQAVIYANVNHLIPIDPRPDDNLDNWI